MEQSDGENLSKNDIKTIERSSENNVNHSKEITRLNEEITRLKKVIEEYDRDRSIKNLKDILRKKQLCQCIKVKPINY